MKLIDFNVCEKVNRFYGGRAGRKIAVLYQGVPWLLKFPESTKHFEGAHLPSYTTSPLSEYIGSRVYKALGIPVHEVVLGEFEGKIVAACKDFAVEEVLADFASIKNTLSEEELGGSSNSSGIGGEPLADALAVLEHATAFEGLRNEARGRFWDMFVVDAFILNNDRNNGNWGVLVGRDSIRLAPVYDNGNALFNKRKPSVIERHMAEGRSVADVKTSVSYYQDAEGKHILPFEYLKCANNSEAQAALRRFASAYNEAAINAIIDGIPERAAGLEVIHPAQKRFYQELLHAAAFDFLLPLA